MDQIQRRKEAEQLAADIPDANRSDSLAAQAYAHMHRRLGPASRARDSVLRQQLVGQREDEQQDARGHGSANAVRGIREDDAVRRTRCDIDAVVANAHPRDDLHSPSGPDTVAAVTRGFNTHKAS